jgi:hypothetical protein
VLSQATMPEVVLEETRIGMMMKGREIWTRDKKRMMTTRKRMSNTFLPLGKTMVCFVCLISKDDDDEDMDYEDGEDDEDGISRSY